MHTLCVVQVWWAVCAGIVCGPGTVGCVCMHCVCGPGMEGCVCMHCVWSRYGGLGGKMEEG